MQIKFLPQNLSVPAESGKSVMEIAKQHQLPVSSSCNGMGSCAECRVYVVEGEAHVLPPTAKEVEQVGGGYFLDNRRLSCQLMCFGDVTIDLSEQVERTQREKGITKKFLKKIHKEQVSSLGGVLVEQDQEIRKLSKQDVISGADLNPILLDNFYTTTSPSYSPQKRSRYEKSAQGGGEARGKPLHHHGRGHLRSSRWNHGHKRGHRQNRFRHKHGRKY